MRRGTLGLAAVLVALIGAVIWWQVRKRDDDLPARTAANRDSTIAASSRGKPPTQPDPATRGPDRATPEFAEMRARGVAAFQADLALRMSDCSRASTPNPPLPRAVQFTFEWAPELSTAEIQQMVVRAVNVVDTGLSPASRQCVERTVGMSFPLTIAATDLPQDSRQFAQVVHVPLP